MPRPGSTIIHSRLHADVRAWANAGLPDEAQITRAGALTRNTSTNVLAPSLVTVYDGPTRCQPVQALTERVRSMLTGDTEVTLAGYVAAVEWDTAAVKVDDIYTITTSADTRLEGRSLVVRSVLFDSFQSRRLLLLEDRPDTQPDVAS